MTLQIVGSELPYWGAVRTARAAQGDVLVFDEFLEKGYAEVSGEPESLALAPDFGGGTYLGTLVQAMTSSAESGMDDGAATYLKALELRFGDISLLNVPNTAEGVETLNVDISGMGNIIIAENILNTMTDFPGKAAWYEGKIRRFSSVPLTALPQVQALLTGLGLDSITLSALIIHTDGSVRYLFGGEKASEKKQTAPRSLLDIARRASDDSAGSRSAGMSLTDVQVQEFQGTSSAHDEPQSSLMTGIFMIVSFLEGLPHFRRASSRKSKRQRKKVEGLTPRWFKGGQRQK